MKISEMPHVYYWITDCLYFDWTSLLACIGICILHNIYKSTEYGGQMFLPFDSTMLGIVVGTCLWVVWEAVDKGYGLG
jgi:hypothetical protein